MERSWMRSRLSSIKHPAKIDLVRVRSRAIGRKLRDVQDLPASDAKVLLPESLMTEEEEPAENELLEEEEMSV